MSSIVVLLVFPAGCLSPQIITSKDQRSKIRTIEVVAMESPPLDVSGEYLGLADIGYLVGPGAYGPGAGVLAVIGGVIVLTTYYGTAREAKIKIESYRAALSDNGAWAPTTQLANVATEMIKSAGDLEARAHPGIEEIPGIEDRASTILMENWLAPIRAWYNADPSRCDYGHPRETMPDAILEIGILNYEIYREHFFISILLKLVDPRTGKVLGRTKKFAAVPTGRTEDLFRDDARRFKDTFADTGNRLVRESINLILR